MRHGTFARAVTGVLVAALAPAAATASAPDADGAYCAVNIGSSAALTCASTEDGLAALLANTKTPSAAATQFLIARLYDNSNYDSSAGYLDVYATGDCTASKTGVDYLMSDLGTWRDRVSSFKGFGNCSVRLWSGTGSTGSAYPSTASYQANSTYVGAAFNDKARSAQFS